MSKTFKIVLAIAIPALIAAIFLIPALSGSQNESSASGPERAQSERPERDNRLNVRAYIPETEVFTNQIFSTGTVLAYDEVMLQPEMSGRVISLRIDEGQRVQQGDLLVKLNDSDLRAEMRRAEYRENLARIREQRMLALRERNAIAEEEYDTALNELNVILADKELIQSRIDQTEIRAPFDGVIGLRYISQGAYISSSTNVASLQNIDTIKIDFSVPERFSGSVEPGQEIIFRRQGSQREYVGHVYAIEPRIERDTRTVTLRARAENEDRRILPGAFVEIDFTLSSVDDAILIPSEAVVPQMGGQSVFLYKDGRAELTQIQIADRTDTRVRVVDGIAPGDTVITTGVLQMRSGMPVRIAEFRN